MSATLVEEIFSRMGVPWPQGVGESVGESASAGELVVENPATCEALAVLHLCGPVEADEAVASAQRVFRELRSMPAPGRGALVREMGERLRAHKEPLAQLVCLEMGKIIEEARGEVQEMIDICDYATGLSRSFGGHTLHSERPGHRMFEQWHPLGPVLCISAFNFPVAVWAWNAAIGLVCGDPIIWKPSLKTPLCALATHGLLQPVLAEAGFGDAMQLVIGPDEGVATALVADPRIPLVSATGSCAMGRKVAPVVAARLGRSLLELGGNNAIIVEASADLDMAARAILFGAAGTAGQRCTSTRRVFVERAVEGEILRRLVAGYGQLQGEIGDPMDPKTQVGPLIDRGAVAGFRSMMQTIRAAGGEVLAGGDVVDRPGHFVQPTLVHVPDQGEFGPMGRETFAPILYVRSYADGRLDEAIAAQNAVEQGLSSAVFTDSVRGMERFLGPEGSDCGIANVNIGTSGAEIGGAFGGEKATGGGREAGSDSWKAYMRRQTCTLNGSADLPLAQGVKWG